MKVIVETKLGTLEVVATSIVETTGMILIITENNGFSKFKVEDVINITITTK